MAFLISQPEVTKTLNQNMNHLDSFELHRMYTNNAVVKYGGLLESEEHDPGKINSK